MEKIELNNGLECPVIGIGTYMLSPAEAHPYFTQTELRETLDKHGIKLMSWYPLGHGDKSLINESVFCELGKKYGKSSAQIILRWHTQMVL